ncbi:T9SS type A sorting domain-containing protein [Bizionia sp.]|uniref:T9SS type A sorting domain-containing protein n=1 Tax=Bizionia sp. TaxID=1954480 RepID=UPI003A909FA2
MIRKLLLIPFLTVSFWTFAQVSAGQVDDFEDGTVQNWIIGTTSGAPENITTGGPNGVDDNFLEYTSNGGNGAGGRMVFFNSFSQWSGNFISEGIVEIQFQAQALTNDLNLRLAFQGPMGTRMVSTNPVFLGAGTGWTSVALSLDVSDFTVVQGPASVADVLGDVLTMRILSHSSIDNWKGEVIAATLRVDNITASTTLSRSNVTKELGFTIYPNPSKSKLNIRVPASNSFSKVEVYNILGSRVYQGRINAINTSINVSQWNSGVYLVRISNAKETISKRFVKQ